MTSEGAAEASKDVDEGRGSGPASPERLRQMHADAVLGNTTPRRRRTKKPLPAATDDECGGHARYDYAVEEEEDGFAPPRLVWAKVKGNGKAAFVLALGDALAEVARRVDAGLSCGCCGAPARSRKQVFHNSGLRRGACGAAVNADFSRDALRGEVLVRYICALAVAPKEGADKLDLAMATAQLEAFNRWRSPARRGKTTAFAARAIRAATPKRTRPRGQDGGDASAGNRAMTRCACAAAAEAAFMRDVFRGEASVEYASAMELTPPALVVTRAQPRAFAECRAAPAFVLEHAATQDTTNVNGDMDAGKKARSTGGEDFAADPGKWRVTSCISSTENSSCEDDGADEDAMESEYSDDDGDDPGKWGIGWKDHVILVQFVVIVLLVFQLMM